MKYESENEIIDTVRCFENGTISPDRWRHREHLIVALYYIRDSADLNEATDKMRAGIFNLLKAFEIDLSKDMPYHETLTVFWIQTVAAFAASKNDSSIVETANELTENFDKDYPLKFYSRERLFSDEARKGFVEADLQTINKKFVVDCKTLSHQN